MNGRSPTPSTPRPAAAALAALALAACGGGGHLPAAISPASATRQTGRAGQPVASSPAVRVLDASGSPVAGIEVVFTVAGGGSATPAAAVTAADGVARTTWTLAAAGPQSLRATTARLPGSPVDFFAEVLGPAGYRIDLRAVTTATDAEWAALTGAAARIGQVVVGDLEPVVLDGDADCGGTPVSGTVEDLLVLVRIHVIDGPGGVLGQAGPCIVRASGRLPAVGLIELDSADLERLEARGSLATVILHELLHVVGFGTVWDTYARSPLSPLIAGEGTADPEFTGPRALAAAVAWNGAPETWTDLPLENCGGGSPRPCGSATRDAHWREPDFGSELMTGWISGTSQPLSRTTVGSLADLGYAVDADAADAFDLASAALRGEAVASRDPGEPLGDDVLRVPVTAVP